MDSATPKGAFARLFAQAQSMQAQYLQRMQESAGTLDVQQVLHSLWGCA